MKRFLLAMLSLAIHIYVYAGPARPGRILLTQPDGSVFYALFAGDEFMKIKMTEAGEAIIQDPDGWWCYAAYDAQGHKSSTGCRVGEGRFSEADDRIPYEILSQRASERRRKAEYARIMRTGGQMRLQASDASGADKAGLVILVQFAGQNENFKSSVKSFVSMLTQDGYSSNGATGSAKEYFDKQFGGKYDFSFDVTDVVTVSQKRSYYGENDSEGNDKRAHKMIMEACELADDKVDFSRYDQDGDGEVDNVFVFYAGLDEASGASEEHIWAHSWYIKDGADEELVLDGVVINRYACASELEGSSYQESFMTGIGTFCHEYAHTLGLPDFYDTDYSEGGFTAALWRFTSLMDGGNYNNNGNTPPNFNAIEREILGLSQPVIIDAPGSYELQPIDKGNCYRLNTSTEGEYFLIEYRDGKGWDKHIGGKGVLIYHIDKSTNLSGYSYLYERDIPAISRWASLVEVNALAEHQCADLIESDAREDAFSNYTDLNYINLQRSLSGIFFPYGRGNSLTPLSTPGLKCWGKTTMNLAVTDISDKGGKASFNVERFSGETMPVPVSVMKDPFQDSAIISFGSSQDYTGSAKVSYGVSGGSVQTVMVEPCAPGKWAVELAGLKPMTSYSVQISFVDGGVGGDSVKTSFMTKKRQSDGLPYIYLGSAYDKLPLKVFNAPEAEIIKWKFNGVYIGPGKDCYYEVKSSGKLEAEIQWEDGSSDVVVKNIRITDR